MNHTSDKNDITILGETNFRNKRTRFGIKQTDRRAHVYILGKTGTGKSTLLENMIRQDLFSGQGLALLDPHGDLIDKVLKIAPDHRKNDLIYFNVADSAESLGFNPLYKVAPSRRPLAASGMIEVFKKIWNDSWGPRLEHILRNALLALLDQSESSLADVLRLFDDTAFRKSVAAKTESKQVRDFWLREYESYPARFRLEAIAPIQNKVGAFLTNPLLSKILTQKKNAFYLRRVMDEGKVLLVNLSKGMIGEDTASLLGAMLISRVSLAALSRADTPELDRKDFHLYLDEFQNFTTLSLVTMLSELRKYRVSLVLAHQYLSQLDPQVRDAILGNVGTMISFRLGVTDAEILEKEFYPEFSMKDLIRLPNYQIYLKLMINGIISEPFSADTLNPNQVNFRNRPLRFVVDAG